MAKWKLVAVAVVLALGLSTFVDFRALAQTYNFSGPQSYMTATDNSKRAAIVSLIDGAGNGMASFSSGRITALVDINNGSQVSARNNAITEGCVAPDADISACNPVQIGGTGSTAVPSAMSADGDQTRAWFTRNGALHTLSTAGTSTLANVNDTATSTALIAANTARLFAMCFNDSTVTLYVNYGATASATAFTYLVPAAGTWTMDAPIYTGVINGIWASDQSGAARCTELTQ